MATGSTNDDALAAARAGHRGPLWIVAASQTSGRGRSGRSWASPAGNLHASLLLIEPCPPARAARLGFLAGLALHGAVAEVTGLGVPRLELKWPNDLLLDNAKCAGILAEGTTVDGRFALALGFGVNVVAAPSGLAYETAALVSAAPRLDADTVFAALRASFARVWTAHGPDPTEDASFAVVRRAWTYRAGLLGTRVHVAAPDGLVEGLATGLDAEGRLILSLRDGPRAIEVGDLLMNPSRK